ncbi:MAG: response regulator transcription factor [Sedimentisphaerales bacterium]|nr:response regulator transcription factor [Sedimentisphaerales bacterium]
MKIRILLADDNKNIRQALISLLNQQHEIEVIGEAENGQCAVELAMKLQPDILITDISMPILNGIDATREITSHNPQIKIIALSGHHNEAFIKEMLQAGASAYVLKECLFDELLEAIETVRKNKLYLCHRIAGIIVSSYIKFLSASNKAILDTLSNAEKKLLNLIVKGKSDKQIAMEYHVNIASIEADRNDIIKKLNIPAEKELVSVAISRK